jgi:hypothetical protein
MINSLNIEIETAIRKMCWATPQVGQKSLHRIIVDFSRRKISHQFLTGNTSVLMLKLDSVRNNFQLVRVRFSENGKAFFSVSGETASGVRVLPNINYQFDFEAEGNEVEFSGSHDGYPSYNIAVNGVSAYDYVQKNIWRLAGDSDIVIQRRTFAIH